jgi:hypothetical protein
MPDTPTHEFSFTAVLAGDADAHLDDLFEAGCDDATFGSVDGVHYAEFSREAPTLADAVISAISAIESLEGLRVVRIEPEDLVTASEIAQRLGRTRESVRLLIAGQRGPGSFPAPVSHLRTRNRLWRWSDVAKWTGSADENTLHEAHVIHAINAFLDWATSRRQLSDRERARLDALERTRAS